MQGFFYIIIINFTKTLFFLLCLQIEILLMKTFPFLRNLFFPTLLFITVGTFVLLGIGCSKKENNSYKVIFDTKGLRNGDLLFRNGCGYESRVVTDLSSGNYSHIGIAYNDGSQWYVIHAVPGEAAAGEKEYLKCEPIDQFFHPDRAKAGARAHVACSDSLADVATHHALQLVKRKVLFDNHYNLEDTSALYCTELVRLVYSDCEIDLCEDRWHRVHIIANGPVIYPEDIWKSPLLTDKIKFETTN